MVLGLNWKSLIWASTGSPALTLPSHINPITSAKMIASVFMSISGLGKKAGRATRARPARRSHGGELVGELSGNRAGQRIGDHLHVMRRLAKLLVSELRILGGLGIDHFLETQNVHLDELGDLILGQRGRR